MHFMPGTWFAIYELPFLIAVSYFAFPYLEFITPPCREISICALFFWGWGMGNACASFSMTRHAAWKCCTPSAEFSPAFRPSLVFVFLMFMAWKTVRCLIFLVAIVFAVSLFRAESEISKCCLCLLLAGNSSMVSLAAVAWNGAVEKRCSMHYFMMCS